MNKLVEASDIEILAKIAKRRALNFKIQQEEINEKRLAFDQYISTEMDRAGIDKTILSDDLSREIIYNGLQHKFKYTQSLSDKAKIDKMKQDANDILDENIKSEKWTVGDCGCVLQRIYHKDFPENSQTFHSEPCEAHKELVKEDGIQDDLHDTINEETSRRANLHRFIEEEAEKNNDKDLEINFSWTGKGKNRILVPILNSIEYNIKINEFSVGKNIALIADTEFIK